MKTFAKKFRRWFVKQRMLFTWGYTYASSLGIGFLVADALKKYFPFSEFPIWALFIFGCAGIWLVGFISLKMRFIHEEQDMKLELNPLMMKGLKLKQGTEFR